MPNIEIHGNSDCWDNWVWPTGTLMNRNSLRILIFHFLERTPGLVKDLSSVVIGFIDSDPRDASFVCQPFLRVLDSDPEELEYLAQALQREFEVDVEMVRIKFFSRPVNKKPSATLPATKHGGPEPANDPALSSDAPFCDVCGHVTVRDGSDYRCLNCGNTMRMEDSVPIPDITKSTSLTPDQRRH